MIYHSKNVGKSHITINSNTILEKVSQKEIYDYYFGTEINLSKVYSSPLRKDQNPSFGFYVDSNGRLIGNDLASSFSGDCFQFVMEIYHLTFREALKRVHSDFNLKNRPKIEYKKLESSTNFKKDIKVTVKPFTEKELAFWAKFNISLSILKKFNVYSVNKLSINGKVISIGSDSDMIFAFHFPDTDNLKIYRPLNSRYKWISNTCKEDIYGLSQLSTERESIFLTSSLKDVMTLVSLGYSAIALQSETNHLSQDLINLLHEFKQVIIFYDNDKAGKIASANVKESLSNASILFTPSEDFKDPSDFVNGNSALDLKKYLDDSLNGKNLPEFVQETPK